MKRFMKEWTGSIYLALIYLLIPSFSLQAQETQMRISGIIVDANVTSFHYLYRDYVSARNIYGFTRKPGRP